MKRWFWILTILDKCHGWSGMPNTIIIFSLVGVFVLAWNLFLSWCNKTHQRYLILCNGIILNIHGFEKFLVANQTLNLLLCYTMNVWWCYYALLSHIWCFMTYIDHVISFFRLHKIVEPHDLADGPTVVSLSDLCLGIVFVNHSELPWFWVVHYYCWENCFKSQTEKIVVISRHPEGVSDCQNRRTYYLKANIFHLHHKIQNIFNSAPFFSVPDLWHWGNLLLYSFQNIWNSEIVYIFEAKPSEDGLIRKTVVQLYCSTMVAVQRS